MCARACACECVCECAGGAEGWEEFRESVRLGPPSADAAAGTPRLLLVECDGVLVDVHDSVHRAAFNRALALAGCGTGAIWCPDLYGRLLRLGGGHAEGMLHAYFDNAGWPSGVTRSKDPGARERLVQTLVVAKDCAIAEVVQRGLELRDGAREFLAEALAADALVDIVGGTGSSPDDGVAEAALDLLDPEVACHVELCAAADAQEAANDCISSRFEAVKQEMLARQKQEAANAILSSDLSLAMDGCALTDNSLRQRVMTPAALKALAEARGVPAERTVVVCNSAASVKAARAACMTAAVVRSRLTNSAEFEGALCFQGFGPGGGLTMRRLEAMLDS